MRMCMHTWACACVHVPKVVEVVEVQQYGCFVDLWYSQKQKSSMHMVFKYPTICVTWIQTHMYEFAALQSLVQCLGDEECKPDVVCSQA